MKKILFLHRSVGENLIKDGKMYELIATHGDDELSDFNQNTSVLRDADGSRKTDMVMPGGNTTPRDFAALFRDDYHSPLKDLTMEFDAIVIKSCYPNSNIKSSAELHEVQNYYRSIAQYLTQHADKKLIILTSPPLIPLLTNRANATRARELAYWLAHTEFGENVSIFNLFDELANNSGTQANMLRREYRRILPFDAHPNKLASQTIAPKLIQFIVETL
ncbi:MAG: hypothetical protein WBB39_02270 [Candidatus Saccharimonadales bacterium]